MTFITIILIRLYQLFFSPLLHAVTGNVRACRYDVTCSAYAIEQIQKRGITKGGVLAIQRLASCQPFFQKAI